MSQVGNRRELCRNVYVLMGSRYKLGTCCVPIESLEFCSSELCHLCSPLRLTLHLSLRCPQAPRFLNSLYVKTCSWIILFKRMKKIV